MNRLPPELERALNESGFPWELEQGSKHNKLRMAGRLVTVLPRNFRQQVNRRVVLNTVKNVRHTAAQLREEQK